MRIKNWLYRWYHGRNKPGRSELTKQTIARAEEALHDVIAEPQDTQENDLHWTARLLRKLIAFHQSHWQWIWSMLLVAVSAFSGVYSAFKAC